MLLFIFYGNLKLSFCRAEVTMAGGGGGMGLGLTVRATLPLLARARRSVSSRHCVPPVPASAPCERRRLALRHKLTNSLLNTRNRPPKKKQPAQTSITTLKKHSPNFIYKTTDAIRTFTLVYVT